MFVYAHTGGRCAIVGGYVMHDPRLPALAGRYFYGDFCTGGIRSFRPDVARQRAIGNEPTGVRAPGLTSFGRGFNNVLYVTQQSGELSRIARP